MEPVCKIRSIKDPYGASLIMNGSWELSPDALQLHIRRWSLESGVTELILSERNERS